MAGAISVPYVVGVEAGRVRLDPHPTLADARREPTAGEVVTALDIEWSPRAHGRLSVLGADASARAELTLADDVLTVTTPTLRAPVVVRHSRPTLRVVVDAHVLEVVAGGGLPLDDVDGGLVPVADDPARLSWWRLD